MQLTNHVKTRYAERMAGRETVGDIGVFVAQNAEKIEKDIQKLLEHSEKIYVGVCSSGKDPVTVRLSGTWIIILDSSDEVAITLYKIDFGLGEEFNKSYVEQYIRKLEEDKAALNEQKKKANEEVMAYKKAITDNEDLIKEYKALAKRLEKDNESYSEIIKGKAAEYSGLEYKVRADIDALTKRREF